MTAFVPPRTPGRSLQPLTFPGVRPRGGGRRPHRLGPPSSSGPHPSAQPVQGSADGPRAVTAAPRGGSVVAPGSPRARSDRLGMLPARGQRRDELGAADRRAPHPVRARRPDRGPRRRAARARGHTGGAAARPRSAGRHVHARRRAPPSPAHRADNVPARRRAPRGAVRRGLRRAGRRPPHRRSRPSRSTRPTSPGSPPPTASG